MLTIRTRQGRLIEILCQSELCDPVNMGAYVRAYCHIHGSDHQRSLSINTTNGWGHCFNAACNATVLVAEWTPAGAQRLIHLYSRGPATATSEDHSGTGSRVWMRTQTDRYWISLVSPDAGSRPTRLAGLDSILISLLAVSS